MTLTASRPLAAGDRIIDLSERVFLIALAATAVLRIAPSLGAHPQNLLVLISEGLAMAFILLRRPARQADGSPFATLIAFVGTAAPLLVAPRGVALIPAPVGVAAMCCGLLINISAKAALNRSFGLSAANRGVKRAGPYRLVRHPMYAGYVVTQIGFLLLNASPWNLAVYAVGWTSQLLRIRAEERLLTQDPAYRDYAAEVRFRLLPGIY